MILKKKLKRKLKLKKSSDIEVLCSDGIKFMNSLPENSVDLIVTDPPYKTTPRGCAGNSGGIMSTAIACKRTNRKFKGCEIDPKYFSIGKKLLKGEEIQDVDLI